MAKRISDPHEQAPFRGASPWLFALREEFMQSTPKLLEKLWADGVLLEVRQGRQTLWLTARWPSGGGFLLRTAYSPEGDLRVDSCIKDGMTVECRLTTAIGRYYVRLETLDEKTPLIHWTVRLIPDGEMSIPFWPCDVYPVDANWDPLGARGIVHAAQRGPAAGILFTTITEPKSGTLLYLQNLTALNDYCEKTHTVPDTRVGGSWPELGYTPPIAERTPLPAGEEVIISDAYAVFSPETPETGGDVARLFLDKLAEVYQRLPRPGPTYHDWLARAQDTVHDIAVSRACSGVQDGHRYINAYVGAGNRRPESFVQLTVLLSMLEYEDWSGKHIPLADKLKENLPTFFDERIKSVMRYPRNMTDREVMDVDEKDAWEVDSWYLYHPLANLGRLAKRGDETAKKLFLDSLDYAIEVARHFRYRWPVLFRADTLEVIRQAPTPEMGETDVPGLYAYVMLQARDITGRKRYLNEARHAADSLTGLRFNLGYQFNNTAWSANAMARLWKETGDQNYLKLSYVCLASIMQNTFLWDCDYGFAKHYSTFFGVTPLREGAYIALYEESEIFAAFYEYLELMDEDTPASIRLLLAEFCKYSIDGKYCFYPSSLPEEAIAKEAQNGYIDRNLAIPLEDIYQGWQPAGKVGQEVYGAGAALAIATRGYHQIPGVTFLLYSQYPISSLKVDEEAQRITFRVQGDSSLGCAIRLIPKGKTRLPQMKVCLEAHGAQAERTGLPTREGHLEFYIVGDSAVSIEWKRGRKPEKMVSAELVGGRAR